MCNMAIVINNNVGYTVDPNNTDSNWPGPLTHRLFSVNTQLHSLSLGFASSLSSNHGLKIVFLIHRWESTDTEG